MSVTKSHVDNNPKLITKVAELNCDINDAIFIPERDAVVTATEDRFLKFWMRRDGGYFWPSVEEILPSPISCLLYHSGNKRLFCGCKNGTLVEYSLSDDLNAVNHIRDYLSHEDRITGVAFDADLSWIISTSIDKSVAWYSTETRKCLNKVELKAQGTCLVYDAPDRRVFVGDSSGAVTMFHLVSNSDGNKIEVLRMFCDHSRAVTDLAWNSAKFHLFSSSADCSIILRDISKAEDVSLTLQAHTKDATSVYWWSGGKPIGDVDCPGVAISGGLDGLMVFWSMSSTRQPATKWTNSDTCELCRNPFFWNLRMMWQNKNAVFQRQHHCRRCGKSFCQKCTDYTSILPIAGFEKAVRVCKNCYDTVSTDETRSLALPFDAWHAINRIRVHETKEMILTVGKDRAIKLWHMPSSA